jgi:two-component system chemotaxis response regulator CheB
MKPVAWSTACVKLGGVDGILPLSAIPQLIMQAPTRGLFKKT